jgi:ribonuclease D
MSETASQPFNNSDLVDPKVEISIPKESVNDYPLGRYEGPIDLIASDEALLTAVEELRSEPILGFDTESRPVFRRGQSYPPALLQLAGKEKVWLFQLQLFSQLEGLYSVLADPAIIKAGVAIRDDIKKLQEIHPFEAGGFVEIADFTQKAGIVNTGLRNLTAIFLNFRISKGAQVSNWARKELTQAQIRYAATDAWVSRQLYCRLMELGLVTNSE